MIAHLSLGGIAFQIDSDIRLADSLSGTSPAESSNPPPPDVRLTLRQLDPSDPMPQTLTAAQRQLLRARAGPVGVSPDAPIARHPAVWPRLVEALRPSPDLVIDVTSHLVSIFDFERRELALYFHPAQDVSYTNRFLGPSLVAHFLPLFDAALVHSSSVIRRGRGLLFLAPDEGGKTTAARLAPAGVIPCDDQNIVRRVDGQYMLSGTPWCRYTTPGASAPLGAIFLLEKAPAFALVPVEGTDTLRYLWDEHAAYRYFLPPHRRTQALAFLATLCQRVPAYRLRFPRTFIDWETIDRVAGSSLA